LHISVASSSLIAAPLIEAVLDSEHTLASVITTPDRKAGRGQQERESELATWCAERGIALSKPADNVSLNQHLLTAQPQLVITASYGRLIPAELLHGPRFGWLNVHFSLLPRWRGAAPVQWALLTGDTSTGISIFKLDRGMDTGPIYFQEEVEIHEEDTTESLLQTMSELSGQRIISVIEEIRKGVKPIAQPQVGVSLAPKITKEDGRIIWNTSTELIVRKVRAIGVRPGIWTTFREERVAINALLPSELVGPIGKPGELQIVAGKLYICSSDGLLEVLQLTPAGKKRMKGTDFARGARIEMNESFI
jgi:methionyl-tRNA formyltransferase